jgi:hypothetical protein
LIFKVCPLHFLNLIPFLLVILIINYLREYIMIPAMILSILHSYLFIQYSGKVPPKAGRGEMSECFFNNSDLRLEALSTDPLHTADQERGFMFYISAFPG